MVIPKFVDILVCTKQPRRVLMFPMGNNCDNVSFYLEHGFEEPKPPEDFVCCVQFGLVLWNRNDPTLYTHHTAHHRFTQEEGDWGFTRFAELRKLWNQPWEDSRRPLVENEEANMTAYVRIVKDETGVLWHNFLNYDSKKETGFVGLKNQGATCYLNSLIQSLYFTNAFRKVVIPGELAIHVLTICRPFTRFPPKKKRILLIALILFNDYFTNFKHRTMP
jgi:ubiquitin carboxyl-terminal hydrolase 7